MLRIQQALRDPAVVSWAAQSLNAYDLANDLAVAFRLRDPITGEWQLTASSSDASTLVGEGWELVDVPFSANPNDSFVVDVVALRSERRNDTIYTTDPDRVLQGNRGDYENLGTVFTAYDRPFRGLDPVFQLVSRRSGQHLYTALPEERDELLASGAWRAEGIAFHAVAFPNA
ncbi:MAG: hypothetical protein ACKO5F_02400 [Synechococcus sp.]